MMPGGDTASALAAGCPVVVEAHSSHPGDITAVLRRDGGLVHPRCRTVLHRARPGLRARRPRRRPAGRCDGRAVRGTGAQVLLNEGMAASYGRISDGLAAAPGVEEIARGGDPPGSGFAGGAPAAGEVGRPPAARGDRGVLRARSPSWPATTARAIPPPRWTPCRRRSPRPSSVARGRWTCCWPSLGSCALAWDGSCATPTPPAGGSPSRSPTDPARTGTCGRVRLPGRPPSVAAAVRAPHAGACPPSSTRSSHGAGTVDSDPPPFRSSRR